MNGLNRIFMATAVILMAMVITGCPSSNSTNPPGGSGNKTVSTNSGTNANMLSSFTGPNSVTISGTWTNVTFASTGGLTVEIEFDFNTNMATITWDIDGNV